MRVVTFFSLLQGLFSCGMQANRPVDVFIWDELRAHEDPDKVEPAEALRYKKNSPTLSVTDLKTDRSFFISSAVDEKDELGYFIGYIYPGEEGVRAPRYVNMYEVDQMETLREMVVLFFRQDEGALNRLLGKQRKYMDARDNAGWKKYLEIKQKFM